MGEQRGERIPELVDKGLARVPKKTSAAVIGGGLAGVSAALVLAERGVQVTLYEAGPVLGGRLATIEHRVEATDPTPIGRGFHAFFRQYYNVRRLLSRIDPTLSHLTPLPDYPMLGADGAVESFADLPKRTPFNLIELTYRTKHLGLRDLARVNVPEALSMLTFDMEDTYERYDGITARAYLDSLRFPPRARRMLFDVFAHSFFNPEDRMSAAELLMMFHFYFTGNPEGLLFDVLDRPFSSGLWEPFSQRLQALGVTLQLDTRATEVARHGLDGAGYAVCSERGRLEVDSVVLALDVPGLKRLVESSPQLDDMTFRRSIDALDVTHPFYVWRMWLDRKALPERAAFAGTTELGRLDNISLFERFEDVSARWSARRHGSCVELHAYAVEPDFDETELRRELWSSLVTVYPELRDAKVLDECQFTRRDCPSFAPGSHALRPDVATALPGLTLAGDYVKLPIPSALMERAVASGVLAANHLLAPLHVQSEPVYSVPRRGLLAPPARLRKLRDRLRAGSLVGAPR
jgi:carotenoid phi-ring synthase / carotenoid chi-ring synthase